MKGRFSYGLAVTALAGVIGCAETPTGVADDSWFSASIQGAVNSEYSGKGHFLQYTRGLGGASPFLLMSSGSGDARYQRFELVRLDGGIPGVGVYELGGPADDEAWPEFSANYVYVDGNNEDRYLAVAGDVEVTESTWDRVAGTFRFTAERRLVCSSPSPGVRQCESVDDAEAPVIEVSGSFEAVPMRGRGWF